MFTEIASRYKRTMVTLVLLLVSTSIEMSLHVSDALAQDQDEDARAVHKDVLRALAIILPRDHLSHHPLDGEIARRWFHLFIDTLDPRHMYFTAGDIRRFAQHRNTLDDHARRGL